MRCDLLSRGVLVKGFILPSFLRDYTCSTLTDNAEGKDIVQTTTDTKLSGS